MKKLYSIVSLAVVALGLAACNDKQATTPSEQPADHQITIVANTESGVDTKTALSGDDQTGYQVLWSEGDRINVLAPGKVLWYSLASGAGTTRGTFMGQAPVGNIPVVECWAYYATDGKSLSGISHYNAENVISSAPMSAYITIKNGVASEANFKNLCGLLRLTLKGSGTIKKIRIIDDAPLYGDIDRIASDGAAVLKSAGLSEYALSHDCGAGVDLSADGTNFYIPMPQGNYDGIKIEITDRLDRTITKTLKAGKILNITRSRITPVSLTLAGLEVDPLPDGALSGAFTVNEAGRRVFFSRGNLYWDGDSFEFEEEQYNYPEVRDNNHIGHFFWSRTASGSLKESDYSSEHNLFTNHPDNAYLAKADFVVNGVKGRYRTLNLDEWEYLFANHEHSFAEAEGVKGIVIAPDEVSLTANKESYTKAELNDNNLVFLPAAGIWQTWPYRKIVDCEKHVYYLSSNANHYHSYYNNSGSGIWFSYEQKRLVSTTQYSELANPPLAWGHPIRLVTAMSDDEPLDSSDIEKPEDGNGYDWD